MQSKLIMSVIHNFLKFQYRINRRIYVLFIIMWMIKWYFLISYNVKKLSFFSNTSLVIYKLNIYMSLRHKILLQYVIAHKHHKAVLCVTRFLIEWVFCTRIVQLSTDYRRSDIMEHIPFCNSFVQQQLIYLYTAFTQDNRYM